MTGVGKMKATHSLYIIKHYNDRMHPYDMSDLMTDKIDIPVFMIIYDIRNNSDDEGGYSSEKMYNPMGFENLSEYLNSYPGRFMGGSGIMMQMERDCDPAHRTPVDDWSMNGFAEETGLKDDLKRLQMLLLHTYPIVELFHSPTVAEVRTCAWFRKAKTEDLWFCSDWKG